MLVHLGGIMWSLMMWSALVGAPAGAVEAEEAEEVLVLGDNYARYMDTRWTFDVQVGMPWPVPLYAARNHMIQIVAFDVRMTIHCDGEAVRARVREIRCDIEDAAFSAAPFGKNNPHAQAIIDETAETLRGAELQLQIDGKGRLVDVDIEQVTSTWRRETVRQENLRQVVRSALAGFHLKMPAPFKVGQAWIERNTPIIAVPSFRSLGIGAGGGVDLEGQLSASAGNTADGEAVGNTATVESTSRTFGSGRAQFDVFSAAASRGVAELGHRVDRYKGQWLLQSAGQAVVDMSSADGADSGFSLSYKGTIEGVSIIGDEEGWITERIWTVALQPTASNIYADGGRGWSPWSTGKMRQLFDGETVDLGASLVTSPPGRQTGALPVFLTRGDAGTAPTPAATPDAPDVQRPRRR